MDKSALEKLGFTKAEIDTYANLLKSGSSTANQVSETTGLNRSHIYDTLTKLIEKGFVSSFEENKIKHFQAVNPDRIREYVQEIEKDVEKVISEMKLLSPADKQKTKVQLFSGKEGLKAILKDIIATKKDYIVFGEEAQFQTLFPIYIHQFLRDVTINKIKERILTKEGVKILKAKQSQIKFLEKEFFSPTTTVVYGNKVATFIWTEPYHATLIQENEVANSFRNYFEVLWKAAK